MARVPDSKLTSLGPWPRGVNNLAAEGEMPIDPSLGREPVAVREADNVEFNRTGWPRRRPGATKLGSTVLSHSLWANELIGMAFYINDGRLHALDTGMQVTDLGVLFGQNPVAYALVNDRVYASNENVAYMFDVNSMTVGQIAPSQPFGAPGLMALNDFALPAGQYQVAVTFTDNFLRESGCGLPSVIEVEANSGVMVALPQPPVPGNLINVYVAGPNDQVFRHSITVPRGTASVEIGQPPSGRLLTTQFLEPMPPCHVIRYHNGRLYGAHGRQVIWSDPLRYGQWNPASNRALFPERIDLMEPLADGSGGAGVFVASGKRTYWLGGTDPSDFKQQVVYGHGVVPGSATTLPANVFGLENTEPVPAWLSQNGHFCIGLPSGKVVSLKEGEAAVDSAESGASLFRASKGIQQMITSLKAPKKQGLAVTDSAVAHIIHRDA